MEMKSNSKKLKISLKNFSPSVNFVIVILLIVLYLFFFFCPKIKEILILWPKVAQSKARIVNTETAWTNINKFKEQVLLSGKKIDHYEKKLPGEKEIPAILEYLSSAAKKIDVSITEIKPIVQDNTAVKQSTIYFKVPILIKAECGYHQLGRFLNELENADRFIKITDIKIVANPHRINVHNVQLVVATYVMKE